MNAISPGVIATPIFGKLGVSRPQEGKVSHVCKQEKGRPGVEKEKYSGDSLVVTSVIILVHMALAAQDKFAPQAPSGIGFSEFKGFERWQVVAPSQTDHGINDLTGEG
ncbi:MAG TPA: hypothetical protein VGY31_06890 [Terriglobia bacterium]|nr:hypothetical protein [Terriglobia bacterium]